jgi:hypothetical protein
MGAASRIEKLHRQLPWQFRPAGKPEAPEGDLSHIRFFLSDLEAFSEAGSQTGQSQQPEVDLKVLQRLLWEPSP